MLLTLAIFLPLLTAFVAVLIPAENRNGVRLTCTFGAILTFVVVLMITVGYNDPQTEEETGLRPSFEQMVKGRIAEAIPVAHDAGALEADHKAWLDADESWESHRASLARSHIYEDDWNRLRLRERLHQMVVAGTRYEDTRLNAVSQELLGASALEIDGDTYDAILELQIAIGSEQAQHVRFVEHSSWIPAFRINYFVGVDGLSVPLIFLTALLTILCLIYSWYMQTGTKAFYILFLLMETGLIGVFCALDFFLFYVFWEIVLLPMYFLIGVWGGPRRIYAAIKFFIYTLVGSILMLVAMLMLYNSAELPLNTFNILTLMATAPTLAHTMQMWLFGALFIGFAIKVPVFPFHTWLPDAHVQAPTAGSMILAGVLLKMGGYGFFRIAYPFLPSAATSDFFIWLVAGLGAVNIVYGALAAMAQRDFKSLVAYSSISHMGYILLGLAAGTVAGYTGGIMQMFNHGISSAMMFCLVGCIQNRVKHRNLDDMGGFCLQMPYFSGLAIVAFFAALGLPGLNGFISEALTFLGCFEASSSFMNTLDQSYWGMSTIRPFLYISLLGVLLTAAYILWSIQRVFLGSIPEKYKSLPDINLRESISLMPLGVLCIILGVFPSILIAFMDPSIQSIVRVVKAGAAQATGVAAR